MNDFKPGDLITFPLRDDRYGLAKIVHKEGLALHNYYHLVIYDLLLESGPSDVDYRGIPVERSHDLDEEGDALIVVDHLAVTFDAMEASDPVVVGEIDVIDGDWNGYKVWVALMREAAERRGQLRRRAEEEAESRDEEAENEFDGEAEGEGDHGAEGMGGSEDEPTVEEEATEESEGTAVTVREWHRHVFDLPIGGALFELHEVFESPELKSTTLGDFITSYYDERSRAIVDDLVERFVGGDYGAGHELIPFGDLAAESLASRLTGDLDPEAATDILQILCDMGAEKGYEAVARFFIEHLNDSYPLHVPAARAYCYAVMMTGGYPFPLRAHLGLLSDLSHPDVRDDARQAIEAISNFDYNEAPEESGPARERSTDPFSNLA